jgi:hypothetical protein
MLAFFLDHFWHYMYAPNGEAWYRAAIWPNLVVISVAAPLGWAWSRTRFWPLLPIRHALHGLHVKVDETHRKLDAHAELHTAHAESLRELHVKLDRVLEANSPKPDPPSGFSGRAVE